MPHAQANLLGISSLQTAKLSPQGNPSGPSRHEEPFSMAALNVHLTSMSQHQQLLRNFPNRRAMGEGRPAASTAEDVSSSEEEDEEEESGEMGGEEEEGGEERMRARMRACMRVLGFGNLVWKFFLTCLPKKLVSLW
jgi:hypothetical protein